MKRTIPSQFLPLALAVVAVAPAAWGQTMSATVRYQAPVPPSPASGYTARYPTSIPYVGGIPDCADTALGLSKCVAAGQPADGVLNADDLICSAWGGGDPARRVGAFAIAYFNTQDCLYHARVAHRSGLLGVAFSGEVFPLDRSIGYLILLSTVNQQGQDFTYTWVDQCDPAFPPVTISGLACSPGLTYLHLPHATDVEDADEILCGQRGIDWFDVDGDGDPDECPNGLFDGLHGISVGMFDNAAPPAVQQWIFRGVTRSSLSPTPFFYGQNLALHPGDGPMVSVSPAQLPRTWAPATTCSDEQ